MVVHTSLTDEIEKKKSRILGNPSYYFKRANRIKNCLRKSGHAYSFWMEHPDMRMQMLDNQSKGIGNGYGVNTDLRRIARQGIKRINDAWIYLSQDCPRSIPFVRYVSSELVKDVGKIIDPTKNSNGFRNHRVSLCFKNYTPPNPIKIPELIDGFIDEIKHSDYHPVEAAIETHLRITGIQPFADGNKRTARILQDKILWDNDLPPLVVPAGERKTYIDLLENALAGYRDKRIDNVRPFFDYMAGKVNGALDTILNDL